MWIPIIRTDCDEYNPTQLSKFQSIAAQKARRKKEQRNEMNEEMYFKLCI